MISTDARGLVVPAAPAIIRPREYRFVGRRKTVDVAFNLRMPAGSPGDITRHTPPGTIEQCLAAAITPPTGYGQAVVADGLSDNAVRLVQAGDTALTAIYGVTVRPYPFQQATTANNYGGVPFGGGVLAVNQPVDVLRSGYILGYINPTGGVAPLKGGTVYVWIAATSGAHIQGSFESAATGGSTITLDAKSTFSGGVDASNYGEICFNI
jgi:hypothetical protein